MITTRLISRKDLTLQEIPSINYNPKGNIQQEDLT